MLKPEGILAWGQGMKFVPYLANWFGPHRVWSPLWTAHGLNFVPNVWVVQTQDRRPIEHPNNMIVRVNRRSFVPLKRLHPCLKPVEELAFLVKALTKPGQLALDCFSGLGSTLLAAALRRSLPATIRPGGDDQAGLLAGLLFPCGPATSSRGPCPPRHGKSRG